jgi:3-deoxy-D-arabino-heptulosonate 7-phosphate (DAHP) synthase
VSVTDACIDWAATERLLLELNARLASCARINHAIRQSSA